MSTLVTGLRAFTWSNVLIHSSQVVGFAALTGLCAHAKFFLPFTPVPITLQTMAVLLSGAILGSKKGAASQGLLILLGLAGLPVFANASIVTGGYLMGFVLAAYVAGWMFENHNTNKLWKRSALLFLASLFVFLPGVVWLKALTGVSYSKALALGFFPFLIGDLVKTFGAALFLGGLRKISSKSN